MTLSTSTLSDQAAEQFSTLAETEAEYNNVTQAIEDDREPAKLRDLAAQAIAKENRMREDAGSRLLTDVEKLEIVKSFAPSAMDMAAKAARSAQERMAQAVKDMEERGKGVQIKAEFKCGTEQPDGTVIKHFEFITISAYAAQFPTQVAQAKMSKSTMTCTACWRQGEFAKVEEWEAEAGPVPITGNTQELIDWARSNRHRAILLYREMLAGLANGDQVIYEQFLAHEERAMCNPNSRTWIDMGAHLPSKKQPENRVLYAINVVSDEYAVSKELPPLMQIYS